MMALDLQGLKVWVTRPPPEGEIWCEKIRAAKGKALNLPTIAILPPKDPSLLAHQIATLDQFDWLIFISPQAVYKSSALIHEHWPHFPKKLRTASVGPATAEALVKAHLPRPISPLENWQSEGLLNLPEFQSISGQKIALITGMGGRPHLAEQLIVRGASVEHLYAYQRGVPAIDGDLYKNALANVNIIVCTSNDIIKNLRIILGDAAWQQACQLPMLVISERMRAFAEQQGIIHILLAPEVSIGAIMALLGQKKDYLCQIQKNRTS